VDRIGQTVAAHGTIEMGSSLARRWSLHAYLYRRHYITLVQDWPSADFYLDAVESAPQHPVTAGLASYVLMRRPRVALGEVDHESR
jgi:hypothetical protein